MQEADTSDGDGNTTGDLAEGWVDRGDGVGRTNNLGHIEGVEIVEPSVVPATEDNKSTVALVVGHGGVLTRLGALVILGHDVLPLHGLEVHVAGSVDAGTEGTGLGLAEVGALTSEDEVLPGGDGLDHDGGVVPPGDTIRDVGVSPLTSVKVEQEQVGELRLRVPATVRVKLVVDDEDGVATTADGGRLCLLDGVVLVPRLRLQVEAEDVGEGGAGVVETTMATVDVDLAVVVGSSHVGSGIGCTDRRLLVRGTINVALNALPNDLWVVQVGHFQEPAVVEADCGAGVTTEDKDVLLGGQEGNMLGPGDGYLVSLDDFLFPMRIL